MAFQRVRDGEYPGTTLPVFKVYDADEYNDVSVRNPRPVGEVWGVGVKGVTGEWISTGVGFQRSAAAVVQGYSKNHRSCLLAATETQHALWSPPFPLGSRLGEPAANTG